MRVVLDTNTIVSGVISTGPPRQLVDAAKRGDFELATSPTLLAELLDVLGRKKFAARLTQAGSTPADIVNDLQALALIVTPPSAPRVVALDPDDDQVLACAVASNADLIVSGDKRDLLPLQTYQGIPIITAREAVERITA